MPAGQLATAESGMQSGPPQSIYIPYLLIDKSSVHSWAGG